MAQTSSMMQEVMALLNLGKEWVLRAGWLNHLDGLPTHTLPQEPRLAQSRTQGTKIPSLTCVL